MRIYLKDYVAPKFDLPLVQLHFQLDATHTVVRSKLHFQNLKSTQIELNGDGLQPRWIKINGEEITPRDYTLTEECLTLKNLPPEFTFETEVVLNPKANTNLEGLYMSGPHLVTQCEAQGFRHITFFPDRPDVMSLYEVTLVADKSLYPVLLSNGDRGDSKVLEGNQHQIFWKDPHKKPCYLFALVAGDLGLIKDEFTTTSGRKVSLEVYAEHGKQNRCHHAMESLKKSMRWDEERFGLEYDLGEYMIVAIDDFNAGAMENKGLNIFNSRLVLADTESATDADFYAIESVVAHEYFHNWTGNRITLRDWFQLSLKEGLTVFRDQEFSGDLGDRGLQRISDVVSLRTRQFAEDAGPNSHPVRPESCLAVDNFFTPTIYEKGAELIRMMQTTVGRKGFKKGMDLYFKRHDGQAVTTEDFSQAIAEANNADFSVLNKWYHQAGTPVLHVEDKFNSKEKEYVLELKQSIPHLPTQHEKDPFHIPVKIDFYDSTGKQLPVACDDVVINTDGDSLLLFKERAKTYRFKGLSERPVVSFLQDFSAPVIVEWNRPMDDYSFLMAHDLDGFNRYEATQTVFLKELAHLVELYQKDQPLKVSALFAPAFAKTIADNSLHPELKSQLLRLPNTMMIAQTLHDFDAEAVLASKLFLEEFLGKTFEPQWKAIFELTQNSDPADLSVLAMGQRSLNGLALHYMASGNLEKHSALVYELFKKSKNMTDQIATLAILVNSPSEFKEKALIEFKDRWQHDSLVMNKWFAVQAGSVCMDTFFEVQELANHPLFNNKNPNNVYALLRTFGNNLLRFHDSKYDAYKYYADKIIEIDALNAHVAARLCNAFDLVPRLKADMKERAMIQIRRIVSHPELSKNTRELLSSHLGEVIL